MLAPYGAGDDTLLSDDTEAPEHNSLVGQKRPRRCALEESKRARAKHHLLLQTGALRDVANVGLTRSELQRLALRGYGCKIFRGCEILENRFDARLQLSGPLKATPKASANSVNEDDNGNLDEERYEELWVVGSLVSAAPSITSRGDGAPLSLYRTLRLPGWDDYSKATLDVLDPVAASNGRGLQGVLDLFGQDGAPVEAHSDAADALDDGFDHVRRLQQDHNSRAEADEERQGGARFGYSYNSGTNEDEPGKIVVPAAVLGVAGGAGGGVGVGSKRRRLDVGVSKLTPQDDLAPPMAASPNSEAVAVPDSTKPSEGAGPSTADSKPLAPTPASVVAVQVSYRAMPVPRGMFTCSSVSEYRVIEATARRVAAAPQLEVLLRMRQARNPSFAFLMRDDHPSAAFYRFLKSRATIEAESSNEGASSSSSSSSSAPAALVIDWPEPSPELVPFAPAMGLVNSDAGAGASLKSSSSGPKRPPAAGLLVGYDSSDDDDENDEVGEKEDDKKAATGISQQEQQRTDVGSAAAVVDPAPSIEKPVLSSLLADYDDDEDDDSSGYDNKGKEDIASSVEGKGNIVDPTPALSASPPPTSSKAPNASESSASPVPEPPEAVKTAIEKLVAYATRVGEAFLEVVRAKEGANPAFAFLQSWSPWHRYWLVQLHKAFPPPPAPLAPAPALVEAPLGEEDGQGAVAGTWEDVEIETGAAAGVTSAVSDEDKKPETTLPEKSTEDEDDKGGVAAAKQETTGDVDSISPSPPASCPPPSVPPSEPSRPQATAQTAAQISSGSARRGPDPPQLKPAASQSAPVAAPSEPFFCTLGKKMPRLASQTLGSGKMEPKPRQIDLPARSATTARMVIVDADGDDDRAVASTAVHVEDKEADEDGDEDRWVDSEEGLCHYGTVEVARVLLEPAQLSKLLAQMSIDNGNGLLKGRPRERSERGRSPSEQSYRDPYRHSRPGNHGYREHHDHHQQHRNSSGAQGLRRQDRQQQGSYAGRSSDSQSGRQPRAFHRYEEDERFRDDSPSP